MKNHELDGVMTDNAEDVFNVLLTDDRLDVFLAVQDGVDSGDPYESTMEWNGICREALPA